MKASKHRRIEKGITSGLLIAFTLASAWSVNAQPPFGGAPGGGPSASGRDAAPIDLTGYWAALITDDWQYRMIVPAKGDYSWLPLTQEAIRVADSWDPEADEAAGEACKAYAAPAIMRLPTRLRVSWENDDALRVDTDTGSQTRIFHFGTNAPMSERSWQGHSAATWETERPRSNRRVFEDASDGRGSNAGNLRVETSNLRSGYLRKNGVPFSEQAEMTEHFNVLRGTRGDRYLAIQTFVDDPVYLNRHFVRTLLFKSEPNGSKWHPTGCAADGWAQD